jgi:hypothetical protein
MVLMGRNLLIDPHENAGVASGMSALEDDANMAIAEPLLLINQQSEPLRIAFGGPYVDFSGANH